MQSTTASPATSSADSGVRLMNLIRSTLIDRRQVIEIGDFKFRFQRYDEAFEDDGKRMLALATGVYAKLPVTSGGQVIGGRWLHLGATDDLDVIMTPYLHPLTPQARDELSASIVSKTAAKDSSREIAAPARRPRP